MAVRMADECDRNWKEFNGPGEVDEWKSPWVDVLNDKKSREAYRSIEECVSYTDFVQRYK